MMATTEEQKPWFLRYSYPVDFPSHEALTMPRDVFEGFVLKDIRKRLDHVDDTKDDRMDDAGDRMDTMTLVTDSTTADIGKELKAMDMGASEATATKTGDRPKAETTLTFMDLLHSYDSRKAQTAASTVDMTNKTLTANGDITNASTKSNLVDLFAELEANISGPRLRNLLEAAWQEDPLMTLRIIFNARSIHLGKSSRVSFYRCAGWLAQNHPATLIANLRWLSRPIIEKKGKKDPVDEDLVVVDEPKDDDDPLRFDVKHGVAHGYWKDLLNILALAADGELTFSGDPAKVLNPENPSYFKNRAKRKRGGENKVGGAKKKKETKVNRKRNAEYEEALEGTTKVGEEMGGKKLRDARRNNVETLFKDDHVYRALHLTVARLFAEQLKDDLTVLRGDDGKARRNISLCGKWAPSHDRFHDRHTFVVSSIAEILHPRDTFDHVLEPTDTRETYLRYAREEYRKDISALRKHLDVVERKLSAKDIQSIKYERLPSQAMQNYAPLFIEHDFERFDKYLEAVASGKAKISGATLLPSVLVKQQRQSLLVTQPKDLKFLPPDAIIKEKMKQLEVKVADGQWNALVQRIKDSGTLSNCIAIADVSGSMLYPRLADDTTPMDSSIALSLLVADVAEEPFRGSFITFDDYPQLIRLRGPDGKDKTFSEKVKLIERSPWGGSTNLVSVFEDLLLPMAIENKLPQEAMVKRIFVFSDMQFNSAQGNSRRYKDHGTYESSLDRIRKKYAEAGYEVPELVFWNLAGGRYENGGGKPVTVDDVGTALVSGYSQGMLKVFLDSGSFEEPEEEEEEEETLEVVEKAENGEVTVREEKRKKQIDPLKTAKKAVGHKAYEMLVVAD